MACRGVHFAVGPHTADKLRAAGDNDEVLSIVSDVEQLWDEQWLCQTDKAWDAIHRCLTGGLLDTAPEPYPLALCILGGRQLYRPESEHSRAYFVCLVEADQVQVRLELQSISSSFCQTPLLASLIDQKVKAQYTDLSTRKKQSGVLNPFSGTLL